MAELKTKVTRASVVRFISKIMKWISKEDPKMWGTSIIGFGTHHYNTSPAAKETGFVLDSHLGRTVFQSMWFAVSIPGKTH